MSNPNLRGNTHGSTHGARSCRCRIGEREVPFTPLRITVDELKKRMESGEDFTIIDVRKSEAWAESDTTIPESIRVPLDELNQNLGRIPKSRPVVAYCT